MRMFRVVDLNDESPYMLLVANIKNKRISMTDKEKIIWNRKVKYCSTIPAVTHVDYSARVQTVKEDTNSIYYKLIKTFKNNGCPILVNTSFNVRGEPIVNSPLDALIASWEQNLMY